MLPSQELQYYLAQQPMSGSGPSYIHVTPLANGVSCGFIFLCGQVYDLSAFKASMIITVHLPEPSKSFPDSTPKVIKNE